MQSQKNEVTNNFRKIEKLYSMLRSLSLFLLRDFSRFPYGFQHLAWGGFVSSVHSYHD